MENGFRSILHLSYRDYRSVPEELRECSDAIDEIYLKENLIRFLPDWFCVDMAHLRFLCLAGNVIDTLPSAIGQLECLETLDLSGNSLQHLPHTLGELGRLVKLLLNGNLLLQLPAELGHLKKLEVLEARKNRLTTIPIQLAHCTALQDLLLDDNPGLVSIPTRLFSLPALCFVSAERCNLYQLPFTINTTSLLFVRLFANNQCLTHCPLPLERFAQPDYDALEEKMRRIRNPPCYRHVRCHPVPYLLNLPLELVRLHGGSTVESQHQQPRTLLDQALSACNRAFRFEVGEDGLEKLQLPQHLAVRLLNGPVARCSSTPCDRQLFTEAVLVLVKRREYARNFLLSALFCSQLCAVRWYRYNCDTYEELPWTLPPP
ncbi:leucine-rich repeat-containing protein 28 [Anopheles darlingi]|uniref:Leucine-rich repeat-containing protein 28 n=1 Tax=Anopheles darlingi TaxID=43151 RepID=W5JMP0_ANODA|nr:leucine-rich repeat-containing protein 28 [Anopheles darlingi]